MTKEIMTKTKSTCIKMKAEPETGMKVFTATAATAAFAAFYLTLASAAGFDAARYLAVFVGAAIAALWLVFSHKRVWFWSLLAAAAAVTAVCIAVNPLGFVGGFVSLANDAVALSNARMHFGIPPIAFDGANGFAFSAALSAWLGIGCAVLAKNNRSLFAAVCAAAVLLMLPFGLFPAFYAAAALAVSTAALFAADKGLTLKAAAAVTAAAALASAAVLPCFFYGGSDAVTFVRGGIVSGAEALFYGTDSLPEGNLYAASGLLADSEKRLEVTVGGQIPVLYLKGFVGSELSGGKWHTTDKNVYVEDGNNGLMKYVENQGIPFTQYANYARLCGKSGRYNLKVKNVGANAKYVYAPYGVLARQGKAYYDMNLRRGVFSPRSYDFEIFASDKSSEYVTQAPWVVGDTGRTEQMRTYLAFEGEYRVFVGSVYKSADDETRRFVNSAFGGLSAGTVNAVTQLVRRYFLDNFVYAQVPDAIESDFIADFFGGKIKNANSVYFATAAAYIFRCYGFAARYAEGYLVRRAPTNETATVSVTGRNAHAWTEVYFDGMGWLPIEVTPTFFTERDPDEPFEPEQPDDPPVPVLPDEPPKNPDEELPPDVDPKPELPKQQADLLLALKILLPIISVLFAALAAVLALLIRRNAVTREKRRVLELKGEDFGRSVYSLVRRDCKRFGGFGRDMLAERGVDASFTDRFTEIIEHCVYGSHEVTPNERHFVKDYVQKVSDALSGGNKIRRLINRYIYCVGM